jgi:hypothetical protein
MARGILGMGDGMSLNEKAQTDFDEKEAERIAKRLEKNKFVLNDLLDQMKQVAKCVRSRKSSHAARRRRGQREETAQESTAPGMESTSAP